MNKTECDSCGSRHLSDASFFREFETPSGKARICHFCMNAALDKMGADYRFSAKFKEGLTSQYHAIVADFGYDDSEEFRKECLSMLRRGFLFKGGGACPVFEEKPKLSGFELLNSLRGHLDTMVIGQEDLKDKMAYVFSRYITSLDDDRVQKSNILITGPSGTGKTQAVRALAAYVSEAGLGPGGGRLPVVFQDATHLSPASYRGCNVDSIFLRLFDKAGSPEKFSHGVVFLDEFDKLFSTGDEQKLTVAQELLKIVEGDEILVNIETERGTRSAKVDTSKILFICAGAFEGLRGEIKKRGAKKLGLTPHADKSEKISISDEDFAGYGVPAEILGRLQVKAQTRELTLKDMVRIIKEPSDSVFGEQKAFLESFGMQDALSDEVVEKIAAQAHGSRLGARQLRSLFEQKVMELVMGGEKDKKLAR